MQRVVAFHRHLVENGPRGIFETVVFLPLVLASSIYGKVTAVRANLYTQGRFARYRPPVPVISVGNLSAGGTGKTPVVDYVVRHLISSGIRVAIVSRGYGAKVPGGVGVVSSGSGPLLAPRQCGDEPFLLSLRNPGAIVIVAPRRAEGVRQAVQNFGAEAIVLDDGFQHLALERDLDIVLLDANRPFGNGRLLPAGILRESPDALSRGNLFLMTRCGEKVPSIELPGPVLHSRHVLDDHAVSTSGEVVPLSALKGLRGTAFAGIANPNSFFADLVRTGLDISRSLPFPDHCHYGPAQKKMLEESARSSDYLVTTEKDAVKLMDTRFTVPCFRVPMRLEMVEAPLFEKALKDVLSQRAFE